MINVAIHVSCLERVIRDMVFQKLRAAIAPFSPSNVETNEGWFKFSCHYAEAAINITKSLSIFEGLGHKITIDIETTEKKTFIIKP